jgi:hypothetical protein
MNDKKIVFIITSLLCAHASAEISVSANLFLGRSFSANIAREMMMTGPINQFSSGNANGFFAIDGAYQRMWNQSETQGIGAYPFWSEFNSMTVGDNSGSYNIDAYQFGLGAITTNGSLALNPVIYQDGADFMFYVRGKQYGWSPFAKIKSALTAMVVDPGLNETDPVTPVPYPAGAINYLNGTASSTTVPDPSNSMIQAFAGIPGGQSAQGNFRPMTKGLINGTQSTGAHLSDTEITLGYNYTCQDTDNTVSFGLRITAPTGNKPQGIYVLEPINGRGGNWGVGGYLAGTYEFWHNESQKDSFHFNFMSSGIHLCGTSVIRSYDLTANGHGSKYLLVADYLDGVYQSSIQNLVNITTLQSQSSFAFEGDAALAVTYQHGGFSADLGYNVWGRTGENLTINEQFDTQRYAILGRQVISNSLTGAGSTLCQPTATISSSIPAQGGNGADNATSIAVDATIAANRISGTDALNTTITAQYAAVTSKLFAKIGYNWKDCNCCPYLNLMGECEWSNISNNALPQWSLALILGVSL